MPGSAILTVCSLSGPEPEAGGSLAGSVRLLPLARVTTVTFKSWARAWPASAAVTARRNAGLSHIVRRRDCATVGNLTGIHDSCQ